MSLIFAETVRHAISLLSQQCVSVDSIEPMAVMGGIIELGFNRMYETFDFPENWRNDPQAYSMYMVFVMMMLVAMAPDPLSAIKHLQKDLPRVFDEARNVKPPDEPKTNRQREAARHREHTKFLVTEREPYNPKKWGKVRKHADDEFHDFIAKSSDRAEAAFKQWRNGVPIERIDA